MKCDVTDGAQVDAAFAAVEDEFGGPVEVLVSNAGITRDGLLLRMSEDDFTAVIDANLTAAYRVTKRAAQGMLRARKGRIIFMSSVVGLQRRPPARPTTRRRRRAWSDSPARWPASSARAASPSTSSPRARSRPT